MRRAFGVQGQYNPASFDSFTSLSNFRFIHWDIVEQGYTYSPYGLKVLSVLNKYSMLIIFCFCL